MADYTVTPANVIASLGAAKKSGKAGEALVAGDVVARDTDGSIKHHDANAAAPLNVVVGVALHGSLTGQPITYTDNDSQFTPGFTLGVGEAVIASANPGKMCPDSDQAAGWFVTEIGRGIGGNKMKLLINAVGVVKP